MPKHTSKHNQSDFKGLTDWVEIFRAGSQTDSRGRTRRFTQADLDQVVANHDPDQPAKHVITHKELYSPFSYGQSAELKREGDSLFVKSTKIEPQFEKLVETGRLSERSVRLLPTDNGFKLGHIAWLGAEPPAVEGLAPVSFESAEDGFDFKMDSHTPNALARMMRNMRDFLIEHFGKEQADQVMPDWEIESLNRHAERMINEELAEDPTPEFSQHQQTGDGDMPDFTQADIDKARQEAAADAKKQAEADFSKQQNDWQQKLDAERADRRRTDCDAIIQSHVQRGVAPAALAGAAEFMMQLDDNADAFEFSQGNGDNAQTIKTSRFDFFKGLLDKLPATVDFRESEQENKRQHASDYTVPSGYHVDVESLDLHNKALEYQRQHNCDYVTALSAVGA